jgi:mono/diheme cytochrome c family protein
MLTNRTPEAHKFAEDKFKTFRSGRTVCPLQRRQADHCLPRLRWWCRVGRLCRRYQDGVIYINANEMAWTGGLTAKKEGLGPGEEAYDNLCASCHGEHREGSPPAFPSLINVDKRLSYTQIASTIRQGKGRMPAFPMVNDATLPALIHYLEQGKENAAPRRRRGGQAGDDVHSRFDKRACLEQSAGAQSYAAHCAICHGEYREGISPSFPALIGIGNRMPPPQVLALIHLGKGRMPGFPKLQGE